MGQFGTPFSSSDQAIGMVTFFSALSASFAYLTWDSYCEDKEDFKYYAATTVASVMITGMALNNAYYFFMDGEG